ncbi:anaerobic ribonucleoside-triphosphate reductase [Martelella mediterranea]|uniref:Anaerobic ribonucleoside-triphosphate reductase-like protein n=1 Tax=Martelella mediterranea TaxID=293089 RepID=A0A4R3NW35_9HYPH|nr:anaerobic ribonucleoside-triphosphate reductase [Martelella mediterranea]TCT44639.1 anaerobic ribonucleoside-triphosphate reductase-like protein [Martelella mediterranea]
MSVLEKTRPADAQITLTDEERQPCEIWTRVMGYHRPVSSFNRGKKGEFAERLYFKEASNDAETGQRR